MKQYCISYISNSGIIILNNIVEAESLNDAISEIKGDEGIRLILSITHVTLK